MSQPEKNMAETTPEGATATLERPAEQAANQVPGTPNQEIAPGGAREFLDRVLRGSRPQGPDQGPPAGQPPSGEGGTPPEGPRGPEGGGNKENEASPERGRWLAEEIIRLETTLPYEVRYNEKNGPYLDKLYKDLQAHVAILCQNRNEKDPWDPKAIIKEIKEAIKAEQEAINKGQALKEETPEETELRLKDEAYLNSKTAEEHQKAITDLNAAIENDDTDPDEREKLEEQMMIYFRAAKRKHLLRGADAILESVYENEVLGMPPKEAEELSEEEFAQLANKLANRQLHQVAQSVNDAEVLATEASKSVYSLLRKDTKFAKENPELVWLKDVYQPYITMAKRRIERYVYGFESLTPKNGEWVANSERRTVGRNDRETYWRPSSWASYYTVSARNPEQFRTAVDTFLQMVRTGSIGRSPDDIYQHLQNFKNAFGAAGAVQERAGLVSHEFMEELRQEFEGVSYAFGADYNNEDYNPDGYYKYMHAMTKDEGPERWIRLARARGGQVAYALKFFDEVSRAKLVEQAGKEKETWWNSSVSTLFHNPCGSRGQIGNDTITQHFLQDEIKEILIERSMGVMIKDYPADFEEKQKEDPELELSLLRKSNNRVTEDKRREFKKQNLERIGLHISDAEFKGLFYGYDEGDAHIRNLLEFGGLPQEDLKNLPDSIKQSMVLGQVQLKVRQLDGTTVNRLKKGLSVSESILTKDEQRIYKNAYDQAATSFDIAFQMVGISCEKVRRGGGIFYVDRNVHVQAFQAWEKTDDSKLSDVQRRSKRIGRILMELRDRQNLPESERLATLKPADQAFYRTLSEQDRLDYVDHMPVFLAQKFVQYAVTRAKIQFANASAKDRAAAVQKAEEYAIQQIKQNGLEAKLVLPTVKFDVEGNVVGIGDNETVDLQTAAESIYSRWTSHTYWGYQNENRHYLLKPEIFDQARQIRAGLLKPEDADLLAIQLLIIDPTLKRVARFDGSQEQREITLLQNAVNESFQGHWRINRKLYKAFLPKDGNPDKMRAGFNFEDWGGQSRFVIHIKELIASQPNRFARRLAAMIADIPMEISSMPDIWGQEGVLGAIEMFADPISQIAHQKVVSKLGMMKYINQMKYGWMLYGAFVGYTDEEKGINFEGLFEKPTNNSDKLVQFYNRLNEVKTYPNAENEFFYALIESFGRLDRVLKLMRVMGSDIRNAQGALLLEPQDIFMPDGSFNPEIAWDRNTGTSRHSERIFFNTYVDWLLDDGPGGGVRAYPSEAGIYKFLREKYFYWDGKNKVVTDRTWADWLFDKMGR